MSIHGINGYSYGRLFFFYPEFYNIQSIAHVCLKLTTHAEDVQSKDAIYNALASTCIIQHDHPWILAELGRLAIEIAPRVAESLLDRAGVAEHTWLAVTKSFLDATPRRREEDEEIAPDMTAQELREQRSPVTLRRHTVTRVSPGTKDYGLWSFPYSERVAASNKYTVQTLGQIYGEVLGIIERLIFVQSVECAVNAQFWWAEAVETAVALLKEEEFPSVFWPCYFSKAWNIEVPSKDNLFRRAWNLWVPSKSYGDVGTALQQRIDTQGHSSGAVRDLWQRALQVLRG
jgi:hypothetical protein